MNRRSLLAAAAATTSLTGCITNNGPIDDSRSPTDDTPAENDSQTPSENPEYVVQTPVTIFIRNRRDEPQTVRLALEIEPSSEGPREALNGTYEAPARETLKLDEFEQNGQYHFMAEVDDTRHEETVYISMQQLADCNAIGAGVELDESGVSMYSEGTEVDCPPVTATPEPSDGG